MIGANAVSAEMALAMLDKFDLSNWRFAGEAVGAQTRVLVTTPDLPPGTGYWVMVTVDTDQPLGPQIEVAVEKLTKLLTSGESVPTGETPDEALDGFFDGLNLPPEVAAAHKKAVLAERHKKPEEPPPADKEQQEVDRPS